MDPGEWRRGRASEEGRQRKGVRIEFLRFSNHHSLILSYDYGTKAPDRDKRRILSSHRPFGRPKRCQIPLRETADRQNIRESRRNSNLTHFYFLQVSRRRGRLKAKVAAARKLLINCYVMLRDEISYEEFQRRGEVGPKRGVRRGERETLSL